MSLGRRVGRWIAGRVTSHPWRVLLLLTILTVVLGSGLPRLQVRNNQDSELPADDPIVRTNERLEEVFGDEEVVLIGVESDDVLSPGTLRKIVAITDELQRVEGVLREEVWSLATFRTVQERPWGLEVGPLIEEVPQSPEALDRLRRDVAENPFLTSRLVSEDLTFALVSAHLRPGSDQATIELQVREIAERHRGPERIYLAGDPIQQQALDEGIQGDVSTLLPLALGLILVGFGLCLRSLRGVVLPFAVVMLSIVWTLGMMGHAGLPLTVISSALPMFMVALASSYGIHVVHRYDEEAAEETTEDRAETAAPAERGPAAAHRTVEGIGWPIVLTGITSALGSATLLVFRVTSIREFGLIAAFGALAALFLSLTLIPAVLALRRKPVRSRRGPSRLGAALGRLAGFCHGRPGTVLGIAALLLAMAASGLPRIRVGSDFVRFFPEYHPLRSSFEAFESKLGGARYLDVMIEGTEPGALKDPHLLRRIRDFEEVAAASPEVGSTRSVIALLEQIHKAFHGEQDGADGDGLPDSRELVAQYLLLYSMAGDPGSFGDLIDADDQRTKLRLMITTSDQEDHTRLFQRLRNDAETRFAGLARAELGGDVMFWLAQVRYIVTGKILNMILAVLVVLVFCALVLRSPVAGLYSVLPLGISMVLTFGLMGLTGIRLEAGTAIITAIGVGIGVDFAIHFLSRLREERDRGRPLPEAVTRTAETAGTAVLYDVLSNILGFGVFVFSGFLPLRYFGWLISLMMLTVSFGVLVLYPALLGLRTPRFLRTGADVKQAAGPDLMEVTP